MALTANLAERHALELGVDHPRWFVEYLDAAGCARVVRVLLRGTDEVEDGEDVDDAGDRDAPRGTADEDLLDDRSPPPGAHA